MAESILGFEKPLLELEEKIQEMKRLVSKNKKANLASQIEELEQKAEEVKKEIYEHLTPWQKVQIARHPNRPYTKDYIQKLFSDFVELHGDRNYYDDSSIVGGFAKFDEILLLIIGHQKGKDTKENLKRNFGMPHPEGYRKALRLMKLAEKFNLPLVTLVDTPGAYPGVGAEERGQAEAIARNLKEMSCLKIPIVVVIIGEGGSGGALALAVGDRILMLENAIYSVISPEGCATILWKDRLLAPKAAEFLKLTSRDLLKFKVIDQEVPEPLGGAHRDFEGTVKNVRESLKKHLEELLSCSKEELLEKRYNKFRKLGDYQKVVKLSTVISEKV